MVASSMLAPPSRAVDADIERNALVIGHLRLARLHAARIARSCPAWVEFEDLYQAAAIGLIDAARTFRADRGCQFSTFAACRIRGAILDYLRRADFLTRGHRAQVRDDPPLHVPIESGQEDRRATASQTVEERDQIAVVLSCLSSRERAIVVLYDLEGLSMREIGRSLGMSENRVSQIRANVLARLRARWSRCGQLG
jgi:RNA polymerase sigma factor for flagellar operon FliA